MVKQLTDDHKKALAEGRTAAAAVKRYLKALSGEFQPSGSAKEKIEDQLHAVHEALALKPTLTKTMDLLAKKAKLEERLEGASDVPGDMESLEAGFVRHAKGYAEKKGYPRIVFEQIGVDGEVLDRAGIL